MSFDVFLASFRDGISAAADAASANKVLERHNYKHDRNAYVVKLDDGTRVELFASGLDGEGGKPFTGGMFALRGISDAVGAFIFEFSRAAGCIIIPAMEPACILLPSESSKHHVPGDLVAKRQAIVVNDGAEVVAALKGGHAAWQAYRDQVVEASNCGPGGET